MFLISTPILFLSIASDYDKQMFVNVRHCNDLQNLQCYCVYKTYFTEHFYSICYIVNIQNATFPIIVYVSFSCNAIFTIQ